MYLIFLILALTILAGNPGILPGSMDTVAAEPGIFPESMDTIAADPGILSGSMETVAAKSGTLAGNPEALAFNSGKLTADTDPAGTEELASANISGVVIDIETGEPVSFAYLHLEEINRTATTDREGRFQMSNVPEGIYLLYVHRIGYVTQSRIIEVDADDMPEIELRVRPTVLTGQAVEITGDAELTMGANIEHASITILGEHLRRDLGGTLSETLENQPGFSQRTMGPTPGRPVIRGLGNERVLILQDGVRTGDASWTSPDHSVTVDPASAEEIEVARGPAALLHGSNAIGGVINVVSNQIPNSIPASTTGNFSLMGTTVNLGGMAGGSVAVPVDDFVFNVDINGRAGGNYRTPAGTFNNTSLKSTQNALGGSYIGSWGYAGLSGSMYLSEYGIPPDPEGGHPAGVDIEMEKYQMDTRSEIIFRDSFFWLLEIQGSLIHYQHRELEAGGIIGTEYIMGTSTTSAKAYHKGWGLVESGVIGVSGEFSSNAVRGARTPDSRFYTASVFSMQETDIGPLHLEAGFRLDHVVADPVTERLSATIGHIRRRSFTALASSLSAIYDFGGGHYLGSTFIHSFRPPSFEELYSEGPHLAAYSYEVGNPDLSAERGLGSELFYRYKGSEKSIQFAGYYNYFGNYLHAQNTGQPSPRRSDLNLYRYVGTRAAIYGLEFAAELELMSNIVLEGSLAYTAGDRVVSEEEKAVTGLEESRQPLPLIPPFSSVVGLRYSQSSFSLGGQVRLAARQTRVGEIETETPGYSVFNLNAQYRFSAGGTFHTLALNMQNLLNETYYNHLSRIKELYPEPGRNMKLLYRIYF